MSDYLHDQIVDGGDLSGDLASSIMDIRHLYVGAIHLIWTGSPVGDFTVEASAKKVSKSSDLADADFETVADSTQAAGGGAGSHVYNLTDLGYRWLRLKFTSTSGTGSLDAWAIAKGN